MTDEKYIFLKRDKYSIIRTFANKKYCFGEFSSLTEAIEARNQLEYEGWPISSDKVKIDDLSDEDYLNFSFKVGKSYKHGFLVLTRHETEDLIPRLPYEKECDIILDGIRANIRLNVVLRLIVTKGNEEITEYLKELSENDPKQRAVVKFLLNQEENNPIKKDVKELWNENLDLKEKLEETNKQMEEIKRRYESKIRDLNQIIDSF